MSNYTKTTDFEAKDSLPTGDSGKIIRGAEFETEFDAISTAIATKADTAGPTFTGTLTFETISDGTIGVTAFVDEDDMSSDSATLVPTQQSVKAYVDAQVTAQDLDFQANTGGALSIDLDSETLTFTGGTGIDTSGALNEVTFAIDSTVTTLTGTQTLTNKTLTSAVLNTGVSGTAVLDEDDMVSDSATQLATQQSIKAYVDSQVAGADTLSEVLANGNTTGGTDIAVGTGDDITFADSSKAIFGAGSDLQIYHNGSASYITDSGTGNLLIQGTDVRLQNAGATANYLKGTDGAEVSLFYAGGQKLVTASTGIDVTGGVTTDAYSYLNGLRISGADTGNTIYQQSGALSISSASGDISLKPSGATILTASSTGIDVTGTVTADGLTVDGDAKIKTGGPNRGLLVGVDLSNSDSGLYYESTGRLHLRGRGGYPLEFNTAATAGTNLKRMDIASNGDISFYEDTGTTAKLFWDASEESLGIGGATVSSSYAISADRGFRSLSSIPNLTLVETDSSNQTWQINSTGAKLTFRDVSRQLDRIVIDTAGNVGIGTGSPSVPLHVVKASPELRLQDSDDNGYLALNHNGANSYVSTTQGGILFRTGGTTERMRINSNGHVGIGTSSPRYDLSVSGNNATAMGIALDNASGSGTADISILGASYGSHQAGAGEVWFYSPDNINIGGATGNTNNIKFLANNKINMFIEGSSGNVGIGTSSPSNPLHIATSSTDVAKFATTGAYTFVTLDNATRNWALSVGSRFDIYDRTAASTRMSIDSSGNLLVGKTSDDNTTTGMVVGQNGFTKIVRTSGTANVNTVLSLNRLATDGEILRLQKDGSTVGSIGTSGGLPYLTGSSSGLKISSGNIRPVNGSGANLDNSVDLGKSDTRWKDLYLSGTLNGDKYDIHTEGGGSLYQTDGYVRFANGSTETARIDSSGRLLVGTTSANGVDGVTINNGGYVYSNRAGGVSGYFDRGTSDGSIVEFRKDGSAVGSIRTTDSDLIIHSAVSGHAGLRFGNGYVGPTNNSGVITDNAISLGISSHRFTDLYLSGSAKSQGVELEDIKAKDTNGLNLQTSNGQKRVILNNSGNVLVGTTDTVIWNDTSGEGVVIGPNAIQVARASDTCLLLNRQSTDGILQVFASRGVQVGSVSVTTTATTYNTSSDQRLKDNIVDAPSASDDIDAIQVRSFDWKADGSHQKYGMVAQELQSVAPEAVSQGETEEDMMGVDYSKLVPMMLKEIQSLRARVAQLEGEN